MICVRKIWKDPWHPHRCGKPAKFTAGGEGPSRIPLCGIHAKQALRYTDDVKPIESEHSQPGDERGS